MIYLPKIYSDSKILFYDIESAPNLAYVWGKYEQDVISFKEEWFMMSFAYKWQGKPVHAYGLSSFSGYKPHSTDDKQLVKKLHETPSEADVIIAHNGNKFDIRKSNARFIYYNLPPIPPTKFIDTLLIARKYFMFNSNKLDDLCRYLGIGKKVHTGGFDLWQGCMEGKRKSWGTMLTYNKNDVIILEKLYNKLLPWTQTITSSKNICTLCKGTHFNKHGYYFTNSKKYTRLQCQDCGTWIKMLCIDK